MVYRFQRLGVRASEGGLKSALTVKISAERRLGCFRVHLGFRV